MTQTITIQPSVSGAAAPSLTHFIAYSTEQSIFAFYTINVWQAALSAPTVKVYVPTQAIIDSWDLYTKVYNQDGSITLTLPQPDNEEIWDDLTSSDEDNLQLVRTQCEELQHAFDNLPDGASPRRHSLRQRLLLTMFQCTDLETRVILNSALSLRANREVKKNLIQWAKVMKRIGRYAANYYTPRRVADATRRKWQITEEETSPINLTQLLEKRERFYTALAASTDVGLNMTDAQVLVLLQAAETAGS